VIWIQYLLKSEIEGCICSVCENVKLVVTDLLIRAIWMQRIILGISWLAGNMTLLILAQEERCNIFSVGKFIFKTT
jgi:hypothetical protein